MKVIAVNASPRHEGNTAKLAAAFLAGAAEAGAATEVFNLEGMRVHACIACAVCKNNRNLCAINDDMQKLYEEIQSASALMLAFPVYMWQMAAQAKVFVDRLYAFLNRDFTNSLRGTKRLVLGVTQGNPDPAAFRPYLDSTADMLRFLGFQVAGMVVAPGMRDTADINRAPEALAAARRLGGEVARGGA